MKKFVLEFLAYVIPLASFFLTVLFQIKTGAGDWIYFPSGIVGMWVFEMVVSEIGRTDD